MSDESNDDRAARSNTAASDSDDEAIASRLPKRKSKPKSAALIDTDSESGSFVLYILSSPST